MTARQQAERDIRESLRQEGRSFITFRRELNAPIGEIVDSYLSMQSSLPHVHKSYCMSAWNFDRKYGYEEKEV